jgi:hypothetical protein
VGNKTYRVAKLLHKVNTLCKNPNVDWQAKRMVCALLSDVLHDTGNYEGFGYNAGFETKEDEYNRSYYVSSDLVDEYMKIYHKKS